MSIKTIIYIFIVWLILNVVFPIFLKSIERIYQPQIDLFVKGTASLIKKFFIRLLQLVVIIIFLPLIILISLLERMFPKISSIEFFANLQTTKTIALDKNFPEIIMKDIKHER